MQSIYPPPDHHYRRDSMDSRLRNSTSTMSVHSPSMNFSPSIANLDGALSLTANNFQWSHCDMKATTTDSYASTPAPSQYYPRHENMMMQNSVISDHRHWQSSMVPDPNISTRWTAAPMSSHTMCALPPSCVWPHTPDFNPVMKLGSSDESKHYILSSPQQTHLDSRGMVLPWHSSQTITPPSSFHGSPSMASPYSDTSELNIEHPVKYEHLGKNEHSTHFDLEDLKSYPHNGEGADMTRRYVALPRQQTRSQPRSRATTSKEGLQCRSCQKKFDDRSILNTHEKTHRSPRIRCQRKGCSKEFNRRADLNRHERSSHDNQPHYCKACGRRFKRSDIKSRHEKSAACPKRREQMAAEVLGYTV